MTNPFLQKVAQDLTRRFGNDLSRVVVVSQNKRVGLFLNEELAKASDSPVWAPQYQTISDLFQDMSPYAQADPITAVCKLYECYTASLHISETIDDFFGWGEILLADMNDIDKQLVDVADIYRSVKDWNELATTIDYLSEEQVESIRRYFSSFSPDERNEAKKRFLELWVAMPEIYESFNNALKTSGLLYEGALCRDVVENHLDRIDREKTYVFVGFNVLTKVQEKLLQSIRLQGEALFYWDYDARLNEQSEGLAHLMYEAGEFVRHYLDKMPNALPAETDELDYQVAINYIKTDSANAQVRYVPEWLDSTEHADNQTSTAIVLADESLLAQLIPSLPDETFNITMGYKLCETPAMSFVIALIDLQLKGLKPEDRRLTDLADELVNTSFYPSYFELVRNHPFTPAFSGVEDERMRLWNRIVERTSEAMLAYLDQNVMAVLAELEDHADKAHLPLYAEALYRTHAAIETLQGLEIEPSLSCELTCSLLIRVLRSVSVPFHGEPVEGLQVMGLLETRSLDFDNLLILSANDGTLPRAGQLNSLIPYCLRECVGLTTEKQQVNIYAYNFFRLLQRAKKVTLMFPTSASDSSQCEMSRFMRQILAETDMEVKTQHLDFSRPGQKDTPVTIITAVSKSEEYLEEIASKGNGEILPVVDRITGEPLDEKTIRLLSPSAINTYINCPLAFYYKYIAKIEIWEPLTTSLAANQFGTVFHKAAELFYSDLLKNAGDRRVTPEMLDVSDNFVDAVVDEAFHAEIFDQKYSDIRDYVGELVVARNVVRTYLKRLIGLDRKLAPFRILQMEKKHYAKVAVTVNGKKRELCIGGTIDRLDYIEKHPLTGAPAIRVVDYKTGGKQDEDAQVGEISQLFDMETKKHAHNVFQTFLYSLAIKEELEGTISPTKEIVAQNGGEIQLAGNERDSNITPSIIYLKEARDENFDARLKVDKQELDNFRLLADSFKDALVEFLDNELFSPNLTFYCTTVEEHCKFCDYRGLCGK